MPQFSRLTSSLTKHGAYKIESLIWDYPVTDILSHIQRQSDGISIDIAQAKNTLGIDRQGRIPSYWQEAKSISRPHLYFATFFSIVFSHNVLINFFKNQNIQDGIGAISIDNSINTKAFSNLKACVRELGFLTSDSTSSFNIDFNHHLGDPDSGRLAFSILKSKAIFSGYQFTTDNQFIIDLVNQFMHAIFGLTANNFSNWLLNSSTGPVGVYQPAIIPAPNASFRFSPSSRRLNTAPITRQAPTSGAIFSDRLHSQLQNKLCDELEIAYPGIQLRLEQATGSGTFIDLVCFLNNCYQIYEVKTAPTLWACLREALPQLLEYQYSLWLSGIESSIYLATQHPMDSDTQRYIDHLNTTYNIHLNYRQVIL